MERTWNQQLNECVPQLRSRSCRTRSDALWVCHSGHVWSELISSVTKVCLSTNQLLPSTTWRLWRFDHLWTEAGADGKYLNHRSRPSKNELVIKSKGSKVFLTLLRPLTFHRLSEEEMQQRVWVIQTVPEGITVLLPVDCVTFREHTQHVNVTLKESPHCDTRAHPSTRPPTLPTMHHGHQTSDQWHNHTANYNNLKFKFYYLNDVKLQNKWKYSKSRDSPVKTCATSTAANQSPLYVHSGQSEPFHI